MALGLNLNGKVPDFPFPDDEQPGHSNGHRFHSSLPPGAFARNKRKNFKPRNILPSDDDVQHMDDEDDSRTISTVTTDGCDEGDECRSKQSSPGESAGDKWQSQSQKPELRSCISIASSVPGIKRALLKNNSGTNCPADQRPEDNIIKHHHLVHDQHQQLPLDLSQSECRSSPPAAATAKQPERASSAAALPALTVSKTRTPSPGRTSLGFWRPTLVSGIAPWIDPSFLSETGTIFFPFLLWYIFLVLVIL